MKILITGMAGMIGFHSALQLHRSGHEVVGMDNFNPYYDPQLKEDRATILAQSIVREGIKYVTAGMNPMDVKRGLDSAVSHVIEKLKSTSKKVKRNNNIN